MEGGGWCTNAQDCYQRSLTDLGRPTQVASTGDMGFGYFNTNATLNPISFNWNHVQIHYCDGASHSGSNHTPTIVKGKDGKDTEIFFRGGDIRRHF